MVVLETSNKKFTVGKKDIELSVFLKNMLDGEKLCVGNLSAFEIAT
jgi:hypothetical protein